MRNIFFVYAGWLALIASCAFALFKGSVAERNSALLILSSWIGAYVLSMVLVGQRSHRWELALLAVDGYFAIGLLLLAIRYTKLWLGLAMLMQSAELALHGIAMADWGFKFYPYLVLNNIVSFGILILLAVATAFAWRDRTRTPSADIRPGSDGRPGWAVAPTRKPSF